MEFCVYSEINPLKAVLIHRPGREIDIMPPSVMEELLFDDLLYGPKAREEHDFFQAMLRAVGAKVYDIEDLLLQSLSGREVDRIGLIKLVSMFEGLSLETEERLMHMDDKDLVQALISGVLINEERRRPDHIFELMPIPNLIFSRDAQVVIGKQILFSAMRNRVRKRESMISRFVFTHHNEFIQNKVLKDLSIATLMRSGMTAGALTIEGGDVLVFQEGIVLVGISARTTELGAETLAAALSEIGEFHTLIMVIMPQSRAQMHLDTIFTRISKDECLVYAPMICEGFAETLSAIKINLTAKKRDFGTRYGSLMSCLKSCGVALKPVYCGGRGDYIQQAREQWTDGANCFTVKPGVIIVYDRNPRTIEELNQAGYHIVAPGDWTTDPSGELSYPFSSQKKYALLLPSTELTRARGGPRCMTMPLARVEPL